MATETRSTTSQIDDSSIGTLAWSPPGNSGASDNSYDSVSGGPVTISHYLLCQRFNFATIADTDTLTQLKFRIEKKKSGAGNVRDYQIRMIFAGAIQSGELADTATDWAGSDGYVEYTVTSGLPTPTQLKSNPVVPDLNNFGVAISCQNTNGFAWSADLDHVECVASYTLAGEAPTRIGTFVRQAANRAANFCFFRGGKPLPRIPYFRPRLRPAHFLFQGEFSR